MQAASDEQPVFYFVRLIFQHGAYGGIEDCDPDYYACRCHETGGAG